MTIKELITRLSVYPPDTLIYVSDYMGNVGYHFSVTDEGLDDFGGLLLSPNNAIPDLDIVEILSNKSDEQYDDE